MSTKVMQGMFDRSAKHGEPTGSGPGFERAMRKFRRRQREFHKVGQWRHHPERHSRDGNFIDPDWYVIDWGQQDETEHDFSADV